MLLPPSICAGALHVAVMFPCLVDSDKLLQVCREADRKQWHSVCRGCEAASPALGSHGQQRHMVAQVSLEISKAALHPPSCCPHDRALWLAYRHCDCWLCCHSSQCALVLQHHLHLTSLPYKREVDRSNISGDCDYCMQARVAARVQRI